MRSAADPAAAFSAGHTARLARLGLLVALAGALQAAEVLLPVPLPWFRLGLGNALVLVALERWGGREAVWVAAGKVLVGALLTGRFLSPGFVLSAGGTAAAVAVMAVASRVVPGLGLVGVSALGAEAHAAAQLLLAGTLLLRTAALWSLLPLLGTLAVAAGAVSGLVAHLLLRALPPENETGRGRDPAPG